MYRPRRLSSLLQFSCSGCISGRSTTRSVAASITFSSIWSTVDAEEGSWNLTARYAGRREERGLGRQRQRRDCLDRSSAQSQYEVVHYSLLFGVRAQGEGIAGVAHPGVRA